MEELIDVDVWLQNWKQPIIEYIAVFNINTGVIIGVGPKTAFPTATNFVSVDNETAELIMTGKINLDSCSIDMLGDTLVMTESRAATKIDDVLHRVVELPHADFDKPNVYIAYENNMLFVELTEEYGGTKQVENAKPKRINWSGNTSMNFLVTEYNDPNVIYDMFTVTIDELKNKKFKKNIVLPKQFSVYTRRFFKNYVLEIL